MQIEFYGAGSFIQGIFLRKFVKAMTLHQYSKKTCFVKRINGLGRLPDKADEVFTNVDLCKAETFTW